MIADKYKDMMQKEIADLQAGIDSLNESGDHSPAVEELKRNFQICIEMLQFGLEHDDESEQRDFVMKLLRR